MIRSRPVGWRRGVIVLAVLVFGLGIGAFATHREPPRPASGTQPRVAPAADSPDEGPGPREIVDGVGVGFSHNAAGAVAAAVSYTIAPQAWLYLSDETVRTSAEALTVPAAHAEIVPDLVEDARLLRDQLTQASGTVWFVVAPLATKVDNYRDDEARVQVWATRVLSADGVAVPQAGWQTLSFVLVWSDGDWRIGGVDEAEGPTPQLEVGLQPWAADYLDQELQGFVRLGTS